MKIMNTMAAPFSLFSVVALNVTFSFVFDDATDTDSVDNEDLFDLPILIQTRAEL